MNRQPMATAIGVTACEGEQDRRARSVCELQGAETCARGMPKKGYENALVFPSMLIQQHKNVATVFQCAHELNAGPAAHGNLLDRLALLREHGLSARAHTKDRALEGGLTHAAVDRRHRNTELRQFGRPEFPVSQVGADDNRALSARFPLRTFKMRKALYFELVEHEGAVSTRHQDQLREALAEMFKNLSGPGFAFFRAPLRKRLLELLSHSTRSGQTQGKP